MGRVVKYRAWDTELKYMIVDSKISMAGIMSNHIKQVHDPNGRITGAQYLVMQFIEIHDKNDNEIYEGDIVKIFTTKWIICEVKIEFGIPILYSDEFDDSYENVSEYLQTDGDYAWIGCEIIGNIHQNIELLEVE